MRKSLPAITVHQWHEAWNQVEFDEAKYRRQPLPHFVIFSIDADHLRALAGIQRREASTGRPRRQDLGIQRALDVPRSREIADFIVNGFPWSSLSEAKRSTGEFDDLRKPGWLPTSVVVNVLLDTDQRAGEQVHPEDLVQVDVTGSTATVDVPDISKEGWSLHGLPPIEVIDGQHRLWAIDENLDGYQLPVVAFHGLDRSWQAYLFYTINISPKRINRSLAYDLYPLLRTEEWLERFEGHPIYRETRAQELTESLWAFDGSPWYRRINMLGQKGQGLVTQASWVRTLLATFVKSSEGRRVQIGGLYGAPVGHDELALPWNRIQQSAFLIRAWQDLKEAVDEVEPSWASMLESSPKLEPSIDALESSNSMLNSDMGVRGFLYILNDLCMMYADELELSSWIFEASGDESSSEDIAFALESLGNQPVAAFLKEIAMATCRYDWRSSKAPHLDLTERQSKARFRGSGGYRELREDLIRFLLADTGRVGTAARQVSDLLRL